MAPLIAIHWALTIIVHISPAGS